MPIKLNKYSLPDDTINQMKFTMNKSVHIGSELGFALCADEEDNLQTRNICTGETCIVDIQRKCDKHEKFAGAYHTHPSSDSLASPGDLLKCGTHNNICIGGQRDDMARCYTWRYEPITKKKHLEFTKLYDKGIRQIDDPIYEKNFDCIKDFSLLFDKESDLLLENKIFDERIEKLQIAKKEKYPRHIINEMEKNIEHDIEQHNKIILDIIEKTGKLAPKYYKEKILW